VAGVLAFTETQAWIDSGPFGTAPSQPVQRGESKCSRWGSTLTRQRAHGWPPWSHGSGTRARFLRAGGRWRFGPEPALFEIAAHQGMRV
jgi:hypothetical protein